MWNSENKKDQICFLDNLQLIKYENCQNLDGQSLGNMKTLIDWVSCHISIDNPRY